MVKRANDETYKRYRQVLGKLPTLLEASGGGGGGGGGGAASTRLVQVLLGHVDPHVAASLPRDARRRCGGGGGGGGGEGGTGGAKEGTEAGTEAEKGGRGDDHGLGFVAMNRWLNHSQLSAVGLAMRATELALIHGPPGTGARLTITTTTTIIHLHSLTCLLDVPFHTLCISFLQTTPRATSLVFLCAST